MAEVGTVVIIVFRLTRLRHIRRIGLGLLNLVRIETRFARAGGMTKSSVAIMDVVGVSIVGVAFVAIGVIVKLRNLTAVSVDPLEL